MCSKVLGGEERRGFREKRTSYAWETELTLSTALAKARKALDGERELRERWKRRKGKSEERGEVYMEVAPRGVFAFGGGAGEERKREV